MSGPTNLLGGLKQGSVWQVLAVYLGVSWVALQVVDLLKENMGLPGWVFPFALVLLVLGLPIILATAMLQGRPLAAGRGSAALPDTAPVTDSQPAPKAEASSPRHLFTWRNALVGGGLAFVLLTAVTTGFMFMRNRGIGPVGSLVAKGLLDERSPVILADFVADDEGLSRAATEAFRVDLSQTHIVRVAERATLAPALERMQADPSQPLTLDVAREVAVREGIPAVIGGEITEAGGSYVLTARVVSAADGLELASHRETAKSEADIIPAIDRLSNKIREKIGESFTSLRADQPLAAVTTSSLEALELYSEALEEIEHKGDSNAGLRLLEEALEIDPEFASAWRKLGIELRNQRRERARATEAMTRAFELRDRLTQRERYLAEGSYYNDIRFDDARAMAAYERMLDLDPNDDWAINNLGLIYGGMGDEQRALEMYQRALELDSMSSIALGNTMFTQIGLGLFDHASTSAATGRQRFPEDRRFFVGAADIAMNLEDHAAVVEVAEDMQESLPGDLGAQAAAMYTLAEVAWLEGHLADAEEHERAGVGYRRQAGVPGSDYLWIRFWQALQARNDTALARAHLESMWIDHPLEDLEPLDRPYFGFARMYAALGEADEARGMLQAFQEAVPDAPDARWRDDEADVEGTLALYDGRYDEAIKRYLELRRLEPGCNTCGLDGIARAHDGAGRPDSAIVWYHRDLETPRLQAPARPRIFERLAQLYDEQGDLENAAVYYAKFTELWADADPELQPRVEAARARLEEIVRERG